MESGQRTFLWILVGMAVLGALWATANFYDVQGMPDAHDVLGWTE